MKLTKESFCAIIDQNANVTGIEFFGFDSEAVRRIIHKTKKAAYANNCGSLAGILAYSRACAEGWEKARKYTTGYEQARHLLSNNAWWRV